MDYWTECISEAFSEAGITATKEQIDIVVDIVKNSHENYGTFTGEEHIPNPIVIENKELKLKLEREKNKSICHFCNGKGYVRTDGIAHYTHHECYVCNGSGFLLYR